MPCPTVSLRLKSARSPNVQQNPGGTPQSSTPYDVLVYRVVTPSASPGQPPTVHFEYKHLDSNDPPLPFRQNDTIALNTRTMKRFQADALSALPEPGLITSKFKSEGIPCRMKYLAGNGSGLAPICFVQKGSRFGLRRWSTRHAVNPLEIAP